MKKISYWALLNSWKSQSILVLCHLMLAVVAIYGGVLLFAHHIVIPKAFFYGGEALFFILLVCYPIRRARYRFWKTNYVKQKVMDVGFVLSYLLMAVTLTNESAKIAWNDTSDTPTAGFIALRENVRPTVAAAPKTNVLSKKVLRQQFKNWVKSMKVKGETGDLVGEAIIVMLLLILLTFALLALACTIACAGSLTLGFFALVAFELFIVVLLIMGIKNALIKRKANYKPTPNG